jgi:formylglycine-generating enzyme required for sulfatase activity
MAGIFISYRRDDSATASWTVWDRLCREFGRDHVFMDVNGIDPGDDFTEVIDRQLEGCQVMLVMIGAKWHSAVDPHGRRRLHNRHDFVRYEVETALRRRIKLVPVLIDNTPPPLEEHLPVELHPLLRRMGLELDFRRHTEAALRRLVEISRKAVNLSAQAPLPASPRWGEEQDKMVRGTMVDAPAKALPPAGGGLGGGPTIRHHPSWMHDEGADQHGRWCEFRVGSVVQRMRWIEPGTFWMGSPDDEPGRYDGEKRHRVTLTHGYWLADTACTQALWQQVMGSNPSTFKDDPQNPVEKVSWDDVTDLFLPKLNERVPELNLQLPTEAQWEYACRAGTETPFSFGKQITTEQANYDGNLPYVDGNKSKYRKKPVPVKALPANQWGMYQMHGNVWEWCSDWRTVYKEDASDPGDLAELSSELRYDRQKVLRGGSWASGGAKCRSANRHGDSVQTIKELIGFRLARGLADQ